MGNTQSEILSFCGSFIIRCTEWSLFLLQFQPVMTVVQFQCSHRVFASKVLYWGWEKKWTMFFAYDMLKLILLNGSYCIAIYISLNVVPEDTVHNKSAYRFPDSKVHGGNMGPTWVLSAPDGPHVGPMNLAVGVGSDNGSLPSYYLIQ